MTAFDMRRARPEDAPYLADILRAAYAPHAGLPGLPDVTGGIEAAIASRTVLVAEAHGQPVGLAVVGIAPPSAHLVNLAVHPDAAGSGTGTGLISAAEDTARAAGARVMRLATHPALDGALRLYLRLGWKVEAQEGFKVMLCKDL